MDGMTSLPADRDQRDAAVGGKDAPIDRLKAPIVGRARGGIRRRWRVPNPLIF
jgi:hypothetical protein